MKKVIAITLLFLFIPTFAMADLIPAMYDNQVDFSNMSNAELTELRELIDAELSARSKMKRSAPQQEDDAGYVWVSRSGKKYHMDKACSNMKNPQKISLTEATQAGKTPCSKCTK